MAENAMKDQKQAMDRAQQAVNAAESRVIDAAGLFGNGGANMIEHGFRRWQELQIETLRAGGDIILAQLVMAGRLSHCNNPRDAAAIGQDAMKEIQDRVLEYMERSRDLTTRQISTMAETLTRPSA